MNVRTLSAKHRGKIVGLLDGCFTIGPSLFSLIYGLFFVNGHTNNDEEKQNISGYYLFDTIMYLVAILLVLLIILPIFSYKQREDETFLILDNDLNSNNKMTTPGVRSKDTSFLELVKDFDFLFLTCSFWLCVSLQVMFQNNIPTFLKSFHMEQYTTLLTTLNFISQTVGKIGSGVVSDCIVHIVPRIVVHLTSTILQTLILVMCVFLSDSLAMLLVASIQLGIANGIAWNVTNVMTSENFGLKHYPRNIGIVMLGTAFGGIVLQKVFGAIYEDAIPMEAKPTTDCYGVVCFSWSFVMVAGLSFCSVILHLGIFERWWRYTKHPIAPSVGLM